MQNLLLIDSNLERIEQLKTQLDQDFNVYLANSVSQAKSLKSSKSFDITVCEHSLLDNSIALLNHFDNLAPVIITDQAPTVERAVQTIKSGAYTYLPNTEKHDIKALLNAINEASKHIAPKRTKTHGMTGQCAAMREVHHYISKTAPTDCNVLVLGETGTGKELTAKAIHDNSDRNEQPLISVNCAAIPHTLIESELFGYEKGAFTGANTARQGLIEAANNGSLFLDEIGELPLEAQARLLRFIQEGEIRRIGSTLPRKVNVRLISATHRDLKTLSSSNRFREDLFYRINVMQINLPPLRERGNDILIIANEMLLNACKRFKCPPKHFSDTVTERLKHYNWPGNIRELENVIERAVILSDLSNTLISDELVPLQINTKKEEDSELSKAVNEDRVAAPLSNKHISTPVSDLARKAADPKNQPTDQEKGLSLEDYFLSFVLKHQDTMSETELAKKLGISRKCLWERRNRLGIARNKALKSES
ncbi:MAG: sigma-54 dependent transcriptional regulator [Pseudomonadota bacterium]